MDEVETCLPDKIQSRDPTADDDDDDDDDDDTANAPDIVNCRIDAYSNVLFDELASLWERKMFCDVTFEVNSSSYKCHRIVLASISTYFRRIFRQTRRHVFRIRNIRNKIFEDILKFAYTGSIAITYSNVFEVIFVCSFLEIPSLIVVCVECAGWHIDAQNCFEVMTFANLIGIQTLYEKAMEFVIRNQDKLFIKSEICMNSVESVLDFFNNRTQLMTRNGLPISLILHETYFLKFLKNFTSGSNTNELFAELIKSVNLPVLPATQWKSILRPHEQLLGNALVQYLLELSDMHRQGRRHEHSPPLWDTVPRVKWSIVMDKPTKHAVTETQCPKCSHFNDELLTDPSVLVTVIKLYFRPWWNTTEEKTDVLGGMKLIYDNDLEICHGLNPNQTRLKQSIKTYTVKLNRGELIDAIDLTFGWCINKLTFYTSEGRQLGPYGGVGGDVHSYKAPTDGQFGHFHCFRGNVVMTYHMQAIANLQIGWACFHTNQGQPNGPERLPSLTEELDDK
ncbi:uncharacterized protein LOC117326084 [Pecten maximus]|uniref:uncharacterized protein LOC117326084 n=1 Tax=Pecten maximus TaxID=6579 RepID=UPI0014581E92|nr:uncharacterized protein LOC117326084 [Pecten maximus]